MYYYAMYLWLTERVTDTLENILEYILENTCNIIYIFGKLIYIAKPPKNLKNISRDYATINTNLN